MAKTSYEKSTTREEHLIWCKFRAHQYLDQGQISHAIASIQSDLQQHSATKNHQAIGLASRLLIARRLGTIAEVRQFVDSIQ